MNLDFRIDWGYQYLYSRRHYHPVYNWDGNLECAGGQLEAVYQLNYPVIWFGPGHCAVETKLEKPSWQSRTKRGMAGIRIEAEADDNALFTLHTTSGDFSFTAGQIRHDKRLVFDVGPKYLGCHVIVTLEGYIWFRPEPKQGQFVLEPRDLALPRRDWARMRTGEIRHGEALAFKATIPEQTKDFRETLFHFQVMAAPAEHTPGHEKQVHAEFDLQFACDGKVVKSFKQYLRQHDEFMQLQEDIWVRVQVPSGEHEFALRNLHEEYSLLVTRMVMQQCELDHGELSIPQWTLVNEHVVGKVFAAHEDCFNLELPYGPVKVDAQPGWNEFDFYSPIPGEAVTVRNGKHSCSVQVYDAKEEAIPIKIGYDMTVVPHDANGFMDWLLDYTARTRLGNLTVFRSFLYKKGGFTKADVDGALLRKWGEYCRRHYLYVEAATDFDDGMLKEGAGEYFHGAGKHEHTCLLYGLDPTAPYAANDMKEAMEHFMAWLKPEIDRAHKAGAKMEFGDASGGIRYTYLAGVDGVRAETMVPHTQHLLSQARPAAEALGNGEWGVHIATQHPIQPYFMNHLGLYYLCLVQPWMMGANFLYEEDSLFEIWKEERMSWDDALTKGKRDMTRNFFRFVKSHPRQGKCQRCIGILEGRYAAPFNGFICGSEQTPDYAVWGAFGKDAPEWGHRQPEKCRQVLDVLMPGASTQPLRQRFDKRRFFFSGTPYGDFDEVPVEASTEYFQNYKLMANLGWNTLIQEDYDKFKAYVQNGGVLLTGLPQFSTHLKRDFLANMKDLALWNGGDLSELCGVIVKGQGSTYCGQWNCAGREGIQEAELSAMPNTCSEEDGPGCLAAVELQGAEIVAWDTASGEPMLVRKKLGKGYVYTLTFWAYPGHEKFQRFSATVLARLASRSLPEVYVTDESGEVFWNVWKQDNGDYDVMLLNTDCTTEGNSRTVTIHTPQGSFQQQISERAALIVNATTRKTVVVTM